MVHKAAALYEEYIAYTHFSVAPIPIRFFSEGNYLPK
jgi:hypothetical protein